MPMFTVRQNDMTTVGQCHLGTAMLLPGQCLGQHGEWPGGPALRPRTPNGAGHDGA